MGGGGGYYITLIKHEMRGIVSVLKLEAVYECTQWPWDVVRHVKLACLTSTTAPTHLYAGYYS